MDACIFGLGRIGLPIALVCAEAGYKIVGIDINDSLINKLKNRDTIFDEPGLKSLLIKHLNNNFIPKHQLEDISLDLKQSEYIILAVGTGFAKYPNKPNLSTLYSVIGQLIATGIKGKTIILRVTLPIGTCDEVKSFIEKKTGLKEGKDFWFSFVPERILEGKAIVEEPLLPKIIGAYNDEGFLRVSNFFKKIGGEIVRVSNPKTAEFIKLIDNSWRNTRFAFANELAFLAEGNDIDVIEAIESANKGYKRNEIPRPGPVSGYCLGKDPYLLELSFEKISFRRGFNSLWYYGRRANDWLFEKVAEDIEGSTVLIAGISFKANIDDFRNSHGIEIINRLSKRGCNILIYDPFLDKNIYTKLPEELAKDLTVYTSFEKALEAHFDTIIIATNHEEFKKEKFRKIIKGLPENVKIIDLWDIYR